jgi:DNA-binding transcriptional MerR regulator
MMITAAELSRETQLSMRQIQTWTAAGALLPIGGTTHPGRGASRQYPSEEVDVAKILGAISYHGISVKEVKSISDFVRQAVSAPQRYGFDGLKEATELCGTIRSRMAHKNKAVAAQAKAFMNKHRNWARIRADDRDAEFIEGWIAIERAKRGMSHPFLMLYRRTDGGWRLMLTQSGLGPDPNPVPQIGWRAGYLVNLHEVYGTQRATDV